MPVSSLNNALSGLRAAQAAISTISTNISNASTPGFTRQILPQETAVSQTGVALGVTTGVITRQVNTTLLRDLVTQTSQLEFASVTEGFLSRLQEFHGPSEAELSISSEISRLNDSFTELSASADDPVLLRSTVAQAQATANSFNELGDFLTQLRNDVQREIETVVDQVNATLQNIADLNLAIAGQASADQTTAALEDQRDLAIRDLSRYLELSSFPTENQGITLLTNQGQNLIDTSVFELSFDAIPLSAESSIGNGGSAPLILEGGSNLVSFDLTEQPIGGSLQALLELRDQIIPQYQAQVDELAQTTAIRFSEQGLNLFTDVNGTIPQNVAPPAPVTYNGFSQTIQVNTDILNDATLLRRGTNGEAIQPGSTEIIDRVLQFTFGSVRAQQGVGTLDISTGPLFAAAGLQQESQVIGNIDVTDLNLLVDNPNIPAGGQFNIDFGAGPVTVTIGATTTPTDLINDINAATGGTGSARLNGLGQIVLESDANITVTDVSLGTAGLNALGLSAGTTTATNPSFQVQVGQQSPVTINIAPTDTQTDLLASLNAIPGITASLGTGGELVLETVDANGVNRGELTLVDGPGTPLSALGVTVSNINHTAFRVDGFGGDGNISTNISSATILGDFSRSLVAFQAEEHALSVTSVEIETSFFNTLNERFLNESGVDIDQELTELIRFQTAFSAAARLISAAEEQFDTLLAAFQ